MEKNIDKRNIAKNIYGENYNERELSLEDKQKQTIRAYRQKRISEARIILIFSITVTLLALFCIFTLESHSAEYIVCLFVLVLNVLLIAGICFFTLFSKYK